MVARPPWTHPGQIREGVGKLTPRVWLGLMWAVGWVYKNADALTASLSAEKGRKMRRTERDMFPARLQKAKVFAEDKYIYSWKRVDLSATDYTVTEDTILTSTGDIDEWDYAALNLLEQSNVADGKVGSGVDQGGAAFPNNFHMQAIGGGKNDVAGTEVTLGVKPCVIMFTHRNSDNSIRYFFCSANGFDGTCI